MSKTTLEIKRELAKKGRDELIRLGVDYAMPAKNCFKLRALDEQTVMFYPSSQCLMKAGNKLSLLKLSLKEALQMTGVLDPDHQIITIQEEITMSQFSRRVKQLREAKGYSLTFLGQKMGVSKQMILYYEKGNYQPSLTNALKIAKALNVSLEHLIESTPIDAIESAFKAETKAIKMASKWSFLNELSEKQQKLIMSLAKEFGGTQ